MITSSRQNVVKFTRPTSKEGENNKCYVKYVFWKVFKNSVQLLIGPFLVMLLTFFLEEHT